MVNEMNAIQFHEFAENVINTVREPLITLDRDLRVVTANRSFYEFFKVKPEETVGQLIYDLGNKQWDIPKLRELLENILPQKTTFDDYEVEHVFSTIGRRIMLLNARQIEQEPSKERIILLAIEDITERKELENLLVDSEERYRRLFETANDGILLLEKREMKIRHANPAITAMLGYSNDECIGKEMKDIGFLKRIDTCAAVMQRLNADGILYYKDFPVQTKAGQIVDTDIYLVDRASLIQCNIRDITENKQGTEETLRMSEAKTQNIIDNIQIGVALISPRMEILELNRQMRQWFPLLDVGRRSICFSVFNNPPREEICENCPICKTLQDGLVHETVRQLPQTPGKRSCRIISTPVFDASGKITAVIEMVEDITEKLSLESQLIQAQKMESVGRLAGGVAHDFNNMLSVILGYGQMISEMTQPDSPLHEFAKEILAAGVRSANITRQLLTFARKQTIAPKVLDLNKTVEDMLKMLRRLIGEDVNLSWCPSSIWPVNIDPSQLDQILANLCINARDAISGVGKIIIQTDTATFDEAFCSEHSCFTPGDFTQLSISDDGCGMDNEVQSKLFEPFFTTKELGKGTGLGLTTVYGIIKQNNGFINVYSEQGKGTTIRIYLPRHNEPADKSEKQDEEAIQRGQGETVLIVEDEPSILKLTARILSGLGYVVLFANRPEEAVNLVKERSEMVDLIITDVIMPGMNGRDLANVLLAIHPNMKCLFMSGYTSNVVANQGVPAEGMKFIQKPFSARELGAKVHEVLKSGKEILS
jgi:PAS domain S-box-containing protein